MKFNQRLMEDEQYEKELAHGIKVEEQEHTDLYEFIEKALGDVKMPISKENFFKMISLSHLRELPNYYTRLERMEDGK